MRNNDMEDFASAMQEYTEIERGIKQSKSAHQEFISNILDPIMKEYIKDIVKEEVIKRMELNMFMYGKW